MTQPPMPEADAEQQPPMSFPILERAKAGGFLYRVYRNRSDYVDVNAHTAADALSRSEVSNAFKIEHLHARMPDILDIGELGALLYDAKKGAE